MIRHYCANCGEEMEMKEVLGWHGLFCSCEEERAKKIRLSVNMQLRKLRLLPVHSELKKKVKKLDGGS